MKTIITTVGTSLFENYMNVEVGELLEDKSYVSIAREFKLLRDMRKNASEYDSEGVEEKKIKKHITTLWLDGVTKNSFKEWDLHTGYNEYASAEVFSILKIIDFLKSDVVVQLISTDTVLSHFASLLIRDFFKTNTTYKGFKIDIKFNPKLDIIKDLRVDNELYKDGLSNLVERLYEISNNFIWGQCVEDIVINMTGGYKGIIPHLTMFGQINEIRCFYTFENTDLLQIIPPIPLTIEESAFDKHYSDLLKIEFNELNLSKYSELYESLKGCFYLEENGNYYFNTLGDILWQRYKQKYFVFHCEDKIWNEISSQNNIRRIIASKFWDEGQRVSQTENKGGHLVFDDGKNGNRIFYFLDSGEIYLYKTFENHDNYELFINKEIDKHQIKQQSKLRKIKKYK